MIQFDGPHIFQMGWFNHQLDVILKCWIFISLLTHDGFMRCMVYLPTYQLIYHKKSTIHVGANIRVPWIRHGLGFISAKKI